jgi:hypothetical protein
MTAAVIVSQKAHGESATAGTKKVAANATAPIQPTPTKPQVIASRTKLLMEPDERIPRRTKNTMAMSMNLDKVIRWWSIWSQSKS